MVWKSEMQYVVREKQGKTKAKKKNKTKIIVLTLPLNVKIGNQSGIILLVISLSQKAKYMLPL